MSVELNIVGMRCGAKRGGLDCLYCFESGLASRRGPLPEVNLAAVKAAIESIIGDSKRNCRSCGSDLPPWSSFSLFGGEPLIASLDVLEDLWRWGLGKYGKNGVQTSGRPIREEHWPLFKKYKVCVAFSIDGPWSLNEARWAGSTTQTNEATEHSIACLERCLREKIATGVIVTLSRANASPERLPRLLEWFSDLDARGLTSGGLHLMQHARGAVRFALTPAENLEALLAIRDHEVRDLKSLSFGLFRDVLGLLRGVDVWEWNDGSPSGVGCTWAGCDPMTTPAVAGVEPDGSRALCPRVGSWAHSVSGPQARQLVLRATPQDEGGCQGCRQMITCKGQCPATAIGGDWRRRTRDCETWRGLLEHFERVLLAVGETPVTLREDRDAIEERMAEWWAAGRAVRIKTVLEGGRVGRRSREYYEDHVDHDDHDDLRSAVARLAGGEKWE